MTVWKRVGIAAVVASATVGILSPAASAAPMPWETSRVHQPAPAQGTAISSAHGTGTFTVLCSGGCYQ
ncbi:hypothetical protein JHN63_33805 [Streptomyces sp. MBT65]|uniref:hypothetical protein n=1 Tax=Streptomyces sp. MBT65 TaxID=1488395 RepID=UPI00190B9226|nr:hypothetical protein [Streptomyces sp. MBT65]MBK3578689.1 hypothetical protein [Streptomyces sp. MBT65]